jgi:predicted membrane protein
MNKFQQKIYRFMQGRYGYDKLSSFLLVCAAILDIAGTFARLTILVLVAEVLLIYIIYRSMSRNMIKRSSENAAFLEHTRGIRRRFLVCSKNLKDKEHRYSLCPGCGQMVRVPRHHGKVEITCPKCGQTFERRS